LKKKLGDRLEITVCSCHGDIFINHPGLSGIAGSGQIGEGSFDLRLKLSAEVEQEEQMMHPVDRYARQLGVELKERCPQIVLDSFDYVRMQKFYISCLNHPLVAIGPGASSKASQWDDNKWIELCTILRDRLNAGIIQLGAEGEEFFGFGSDLTGKVSAREAATVISSCDLLISVNNGYSHLAAAVRTPHVVLLGDADSAIRMHPGAGISVTPEGGDFGDGRGVEGISVASVVNGILQLCGKDYKLTVQA
jgi:ADP-heptose:LPS heptosyltransferase